MYNLIAAAIQINADYSIFDLYGDKGFWKGYFASALITFPIVIVLILLLRSGGSDDAEDVGTRRDGSRKETDDIKKQLAVLRVQLNGMYESAVRQYRQAAERGDAAAQFDLGRSYELGTGVSRDLAQAAQWYLKAAEQGYAGAQFKLGECCYKGSGVPQSLEQAMGWYRKAAEQGHSEAQFKLGECCESGSGVPKDPEQAAKWYRQAAEHGHAGAQYKLGECYESGSGVPKDLGQAVEWYRKAAEHGHAEARFRSLLFDKNNSCGAATVALPGNVGLELVKVEAGTFTMGDPKNKKWLLGDEAAHQVTLTRDFCIGRTAVTQAQWRAVMGNNPSYFKGDDLPVESVPWNAAMAFCNKLNALRLAPEGYKFTLPTEAQWEYAARGGKKSNGYKYSGSNDLGEVAWYDGNSGDKTHSVAQKKANELGLYDMSGNVWEWCRDWYEKGYAIDPEFLIGNSGSVRVLRGGSVCRDAWGCRLACRSISDGGAPSELGFRIVLVPVS